LSRPRCGSTIAAWTSRRWTGKLLMTMRLSPEQRKEIVRILGDIRSDLAEMRRIFERIQARLEARGS
jgi:hypothetical protein